MAEALRANIRSKPAILLQQRPPPPTLLLLRKLG